MRKRWDINSSGVRWFIAVMLFTCLCRSGSDGQAKNGYAENELPSDSITKKDTVSSPVIQEGLDSADVESKMRPPFEGVVDVATLSGDIVVDLKYSQEDNFLGEDLYGDLDECYLRDKPARMLVEAQRLLSAKKPGYRLIVYDCLRPRHVQRRMWDHVKGTPQQRYVANPDRISMHNYGAAVDVSIFDDKGDLLDLGADFDYFGDLSQPRLEQALLKQGRLSDEHIGNRLLLRGVMKSAGFRSIGSEWWHYNAGRKDDIRREYSVVE